MGLREKRQESPNLSIIRKRCRQSFMPLLAGVYCVPLPHQFTPIHSHKGRGPALLTNKVHSPEGPASAPP